MTHAWHSLVDTIRLLPSGRTSDDDRKAQLHEKQTLDAALDQLSALLDMRRTGNTPTVGPGAAGATPRVSPAPGTDGTMTPPSASNKRKRRLSVGVSGGVGSGSPAPQNGTGASAAAESNTLAVSSPHPGRGSTPLRDVAKRQRQGDTSDQLPLRPGRKVIARQKPSEDKKGEVGEEWILAKVVKMVGGDKHRYDVQDADDGSRWITTLKSIIGLPDPDAPPTSSSHPSNMEDFAKGSQVLAIYPDTTTFYRATVVSAPIPGTGMGRGVRGGNVRGDPGAKPGVYRVVFVDDGDTISDVVKDLVVLVSSEEAERAQRAEWSGAGGGRSQREGGKR
jgi:SAGA-associated factor 29